MSIVETYSIQDDFPNQAVGWGQFAADVDALLAPKFEYTEGIGDVVNLYFSSALTAQEKSDLDALVAAHPGDPETAPELVVDGTIDLVPVQAVVPFIRIV